MGEAERAALGELGVRPSAEILSMPHGTRARAAGLLESLQRPPTRSGRPVYFLLIEDEWGLLQSTIFGQLYRESGSLLYQTGTFLLDRRVEQDSRRGFSFVVERIADLAEMLEKRMTEAEVAPRGSSTYVPVSGSRAKKGRKAG